MEKRAGKKVEKSITLDGKSLTISQVIAVARHQAKVNIKSSAKARVQRTAKLLRAELERGEPLYGVTTGFGSNADRLLRHSRLRQGAEHSGRSLIEELQYNLIVSHAVCVGPALSQELTRAMLLLRLNTLLSGHSGIRIEPLELMAALLNAGITPIVPELGSVGASGDLAPLSHLALPLLGLGDVNYRGKRIAAKKALQAESLAPIALSCKEGLALNNGTTQMLASLVLATQHARALCDFADQNAGLALEAFCGRSSAFDARAHALRPHPGQIESASRVRDWVQGSGLVDIPYHQVPRFSPWGPSSWQQRANQARTFDVRWDYVLPSERVEREVFYQRNLPFRGGKKFQPQDSYSLRCVPQVHGAVRDVLVQVETVVQRELNAVTDNPLIFPDGVSAGDDLPVISAGNFHGMPLALAAANLKTALPALASISERRLQKLLDVATNDGLPPFLIGNEDGTDSGLMIVQYTAAAIVNDLAARAHPACVYSIPTSANAEDHVSMGTNDARHLLEMLQSTERVLALELLCGAQALDYRLQILSAAAELAHDRSALRAKIRNISPVKPDEQQQLEQDLDAFVADLRQLSKRKPSSNTRALLARVRSVVPFLAHDRLLQPDLEAIQKLTRELVDAMQDAR